MITIISDGTKLVVTVEIPPRLNRGERRHFRLERDLGGPDCAVAALAEAMRSELIGKLKKVRRLAYNQGAKDRARRCAAFSGALDIGDASGCWE